MALGKSGNPIVVWLILGVIVVVFGLSFGLPTESLTLGPQALARVHGDDLRAEEFTYQLKAAGFRPGRIPPDATQQRMMKIRELMLESMVERRVLGEIAEDVGLRAVTRDAEELTAEGQLMTFGYTWNWAGDEGFDFEVYKNRLLPMLRVTEKNYLDLQRREILAQNLRDIVTANTVVSDAEIRARFDEREDQVALRYVKYDAKDFADLVEISEADISAHVEANKDALKTAYESASIRFRKLPKQVQLAYIRVAHPEAETASAAAKLGKARARLGPSLSFSELARQVSDDPATARRGGVYGWVDLKAAAGALEAMSLDGAVVEAAGKLGSGATSEVVRGKDGSYLVHVVGQREGDVPEAEALRELAREALAKTKGAELAEATAKAHLARIKGGETMEALFESEGDKAAGRNIGERKLGPGAAVALKLESTGSFRRSATVPGLGRARALTDAAWGAKPEDEVLDQLYKVGDRWVIADVEAHERGSDEDFEETKAELRRGLVYERAQQNIKKMAHDACVRGLGTGDIAPNPGAIARILAYDSGNGTKATAPSYNMCEMVGNRGGSLLAWAQLQRPW